MLDSCFRWVRPLGPLVVFLWNVGVGASPAVAQSGGSLRPADEPLMVLFLDDFDLNRPVWQASFSGMRDRVAESLDNVVFFTETLDVQQVVDPDLRQEGMRWIVQKYDRRPPDLLVGHGAQSLEVLLALRERTGLDIPLLHLRADGGRPEDPSELPEIPNGTSLLLGSVEGEVARIIQKLLPTTHAAVLIVDSEEEGDALSERFALRIPSLELIVLVRPTHQEVINVVRGQGPGVVVYYTLVREDSEGRPWGMHDYLTKLTSEISAPVFTIFTTQQGTGILGGSQVDPVLMGRFVGGTIVEILSGTPADEIPPSTFESWSLILDWGQVRRFGIPRARIPDGVVWQGKPERFWEAFPRTSGVLAGLFLLLMGTGVNLLVSRRSLEQARDARGRLSQRLMAMVDQDRSRIARDLHDDLCQEMTVVALRLDRMDAALGDEVRGLISKTRNIARDLHAAPVDRIPFCDAVVALARNVESATSGDSVGEEPFSPSLEIRVRSQNWPSEIPSEVALHLYRAIQECLQNVVRHARARTCEVFLAGTPNTCWVRVNDDGIGLVRQGERSEGLGLLSIRERISGLGGSVRIAQRPGGGTEVEFLVPLGLARVEPGMALERGR